MRLVEAHVRDFRSVEDSESFRLDDVTCLVGKNESGKTALLKALHKLNSDTGEQFEPARDYPRRKWRPSAKIPSEPPAVSTVWELTDHGVATIERKFGTGAIRKRGFSLSKGYDNVLQFEIDVDELALLEAALAEAGVVGKDRDPLQTCRRPGEAAEVLEGLDERTTAQERALAILKERFPGGGDTAVFDTVADMVPKFLYFDQYLTLPGTVSVNEITKRNQENKLKPRDKLFLALLSLAGTTLEGVHGAGTYEEFNASLRAVSNQISDQIFKYWSQNKHLDVDLRLDHARGNDPAPFNAGWIFRTRIDNRRHRADTSFDERSSGFVWFFSFLIWFYQLRELYGDNLVILLDEPGLSLHARAQGDLLKYINEQLRPSYQVIYTTHSPFMIDADHLLSARTVEDMVVREKNTGEERLLGTKVSQDVLSTDPDTVSPLQRALDYEITQTLFIGRHTLLVEGEAELLYLKWFSRQLQKGGSTGLDYRWNICVVRGVDRIPGFVSLFRGNDLHIAAMVDVQNGQRQRIDNAKKSLRDGHLIALDAYVTQREADIEDVLGREYYIALVNRSYRLHNPYALPAAKPAEAPERVVKEVEDHWPRLPVEYPAFDHFTPAEWLFQNGDEGAQLPGFADALARMERVINDLNALMPPAA